MSTMLTGEPQPKANGKGTHSERRRVGDTVAPPIPDWRHPQAAFDYKDARSTAQQSGVEALRAQFMAGATYRTGRRADDEGLPSILINGLKYRPVRRGQEWLRSRIKTLGHAKLRRRR